MIKLHAHLSGPLVRNSNLGLVLIPYRASQFQYNFLWSVSYWSGWQKKPVSCCVEFPTSLMFGMPFGLSSYTMLVQLVHFGIRYFLSSWILNVILFGAIYHRLLVKPHPASPQPLPADVISTQRTKYKNHLTPMGWGGPLSFGRFKSVQHNKTLVTYTLLYLISLFLTCQFLVA